ncbi:Tc toxin subunit A [Pseudomonas retamae]|uniref:Tc toxin subunit A n=1 Tax=Pseudomonas retamae TaxID=702110 RepID=A0ABW7DH24_9PSED
MVDSRRPALQLLDQLFGEEQYLTDVGLGKLKSYLEEGGSIFPLVEGGARGLERNYGVKKDDARRFLRRANSMAFYIRRRFIEQGLQRQKPTKEVPQNGILSMVPGPTIEDLFDPNYDAFCPPSAIESAVGPAAYLVDLMKWVEERIESASDSTRILLHDRRSDLKKLVVDFNAVHRPVSSVDIIVRVLETFIEATQESPDEPVDVEQQMIDARYPNGLPYYQHWNTIDAVARHHGLSVGNFAHMVDKSFPYFLQAQAWDDDAGRALAHATRLGPYQRKLLTEEPANIDDRVRFYSRNFGTGDIYGDINQVNFFGKRTKLDTPGIEKLLSVGSFVPQRSANVKFATEPPAEPESGRSGSVYVNAHSHPGIHFIATGTGPTFLHKLSPNHSNVEGLDRYDRLNRKLRLDQWLDLPADEVDALLAAAMRAEARGSAQAESWLITEKVTHALGLFQSLRERYGCTAHDFAAFIDELSIYGRGEALSQFDQVFNGQGNYRDPLVLDGLPFPVLPVQGKSELTITQLCSALSIDLQTYHYLAMAIAGAHRIDGNNLLRTPAIISSFYRMVKLPRLLGLTPVEGVLMLTLLGGQAWLEGLAGKPQINSAESTSPDVLNLIYAMHSCVQWCADRDFPVLWMLQQIAEPRALAVAETELQFFEQVRNLLGAAGFSNSALLMAGVPPLAGASWLDLLTKLADLDGLVLAWSGTESDYQSFARDVLDDAVRDGLGQIDDNVRANIVERMLVVLVQARDAQVQVAKECLEVYTGVSDEHALQILKWANASVPRLLRLVLDRPLLQLETNSRRAEPSDPLMLLLADVRRRSAVVAQLDLGVEALRDYLDYGYQAWLSQEDKYAFTVRTLYYLTSLTRGFELSRLPAQRLLDYLREVNALPSPLTGHALRLAQQAAAIRLAEFFDWSVQEVRECVGRIDPDKGILKTLPQLDQFMRIRVLASHTSMDALTIFLIGTLPEDVDKNRYKEAAERALLSVSQSITSRVTVNEDLQQIVTMTCVSDKTEVVANKPGEKITFTVTLTDSDANPLSGVNVYWHTTLGTIATKATGTNGVLHTDFIPGTATGTEAPRFWIDLLEAAYAPAVHVIVDTKTLQFPPRFMSPVPLESVAFGQEVELSATMKDGFGNLGRNTPVNWSGHPLTIGIGPSHVSIRPAQAHTDHEGVTRVYVSSPTGGTFRITVGTEDGTSSADFEPITFDLQEQA